MKVAVPLVLLLLVVVGCNPKTTGSGAANTTAPAIKGDVLAVVGTSGTVRIGDDLAKAKTAFPAPAGAQVFETSMNFAILNTEGWSWMDGKTNNGFEAAARKGKIVALALTNLGKSGDDPEQMETDALGPPTRKAESDEAAMLVWEEGDNARFLVHMRKENPILGKGSFTMVGLKNDLKMLNYRADDPETFVKQLSVVTGIGKK